MVQKCAGLLRSRIFGRTEGRTKKEGQVMEQWKKSIYTDLAVEERESFPGDGGEIPGVSLREWEKEEAGIHLTEVVIKTEEGAGNMGKPMGTYVTLEALALAERDEDFHREVSEELAARISGLLALHQI